MRRSSTSPSYTDTDQNMTENLLQMMTNDTSVHVPCIFKKHELSTHTEMCIGRCWVMCETSVHMKERERERDGLTSGGS